MKNTLIVYLLIILLVMAGSGCGNVSTQEEGKETPVGAFKQHDTRVTLVCKDSQGQYVEKSLHKSEIVKCGEQEYRLDDFIELRTTGNYLAFPGHERELIDYLRTVKKER
jgi:hypothetical protein